MSDDEDFLMDDAGDDEDYDFEYEDDGDDGDGDMGQDGTDLENSYYMAKALKDDDPKAAIQAFREVVKSEPEKGDWGFKALKQITKIRFLTLKKPDEALESYRELLTYTKSAVTRNVSEKSINNILDYVGGEGKHAALAPEISIETLEAFYSATMQVLDEQRNERLSIKCNLKLAKLWLDRKEYGRLRPILATLHGACVPSASGSGTSSEDQSKGTLLLEVYATEIQMYSDLRETKKLKVVYEATKHVRSALPHPRILGVIKECGGKMWMAEKSWENASTDFFESFKQYDESGSPQRIQVLKYLVLAYMLMGSDINPFDSQETKPYRENPQIVAMTNLVAAYQRRDVHDAEKIIKENKATILDDPFIRHYIDDVLRSLRTQYLIDLIKPYTRIELNFLAKQLNVSISEVEDLLICLILDGKVKGRVDQVNGRVELEKFPRSSADRYQSLSKWSSLLGQVQVHIADKSGQRNAMGGGDDSSFVGMSSRNPGIVPGFETRRS